MLLCASEGNSGSTGEEAGRVGRGQCCYLDAEAAQGSVAEVTAVEQMQMYQAKQKNQRQSNIQLLTLCVKRQGF